MFSDVYPSVVANSRPWEIEQTLDPCKLDFHNITISHSTMSIIQHLPHYVANSLPLTITKADECNCFGIIGVVRLRIKFDRYLFFILH